MFLKINFQNEIQKLEKFCQNNYLQKVIGWKTGHAS